jgi:hypothetical protein
VRVPGPKRVNRTASTSSSSARVVSSGPRKKSVAAISRRPPGPTASRTPSVSTSTEGISPAGSAWAIEPTVVPRLRIAGWATLRSAWRSRGRAVAASVVLLEPGVPDERTDAHRGVGDVHGIQPRHAVDVDEVARVGQAHRQHRDQALAAGEDLAVVADLAEHGDGLVDGRGGVVHERSGFHLVDPACRGVGGKRGTPPGCSRGRPGRGGRGGYFRSVEPG